MLFRSIARIGSLGAADRPQLASDTAADDLRDLSARSERVRALRADLAQSGRAWIDGMRTRVKSGAAADELDLLDALGRELQEAAAARKAFLSRPVAVTPGAELDAEFVLAVENLAQGRRAFGLIGFGKGELKRLVESVRVSGQPPAEQIGRAHV